MSRRRDESGFAAVVVIALTALLVLVAVLGLGIGALFAAHRRAAAAADLAALAAASAQQRGLDACAAAGGIAEANGGAVVACRVRTTSVEVVVRVVPDGLLRGTELLARARAGPAP